MTFAFTDNHAARFLSKLTLSLTMLLAIAFSAKAQDQTPRYEAWPGSQTDNRVQELVDRLRTMIDEAARARAADPRFLGDLRELTRTYDWPWRRKVFDDDFQDGDFTRNPVWSVASGQFAVEWGIGLRSVVTPAPQSAPARSGDRGNRPEDLAVNLLGALLQQQSSQNKQEQQQPTGPAWGEIYLRQPVENAFAIRLEMISRTPQGSLEFGPYQDTDRQGGYRLAYAPGAVPSIKLLRISKWGSGVVDAHPHKLNLEDGKPHVMEWARDAEGRMTVSLDGKQLVSSVDRDIKGPFDGFTLINRGGDYGVRRISVQDTGPNR